MYTPLNLLNIFKTSFEIYVKNIKYITLAIIFVFAPMFIIIGFIPDNLLPESIDFLSAAENNAFLSYIYFLMALTIIFEPLVIGAVSTITFTWLREKRQSTIPEMLDNSLMKWAKLSITAFLFTAIIFLTATLIVPALFFSISFAFYAVITATSDKWGFHAFAESNRIIKGRWWRTAGKLVVISMTAYVAELILNMLVFVIDYPFPLSVVANVLIKLVVSFFYIVSAVFCFDMINSRESSNVK